MSETLLRVFVIEDEPTARNYLVELLTAQPAISVVGAVGSLVDLVAFGYDRIVEEVDVVFIDVHLAGGSTNTDGLSAARALAGLADAPQLVFATASAAHAADAFELGSTEYLRKPFERGRLATCLERVRQRQRLCGLPAPSSREEPRRLVGRSRTGLVFLSAQDVWAIGAEGRLVTLHAGAGTFDVDLSLTSLGLVLGEAFLRVHRQWLVQVQHVHALERRDGELAVFSGERLAGAGLWIPVARDRASAIRQALLARAIGVRA
jgi:two-component system response regulator AlgR